jgi:glycerol 2-dehydrogenase (NADP+)
MQKLVGTGKVRNIGVSNFVISNLEKLLNAPSTKIVPAVNQIELHPNMPSPKTLAYCKEKGIHVTAYSCLGSTDSPLAKDQTLQKIADAHGKTPQQVLLQWGLQVSNPLSRQDRPEREISFPRRSLQPVI